MAKKLNIKITEHQAELLLSLLKESNTTDNTDWDVQMDLIIASVERELDK